MSLDAERLYLASVGGQALQGGECRRLQLVEFGQARAGGVAADQQALRFGVDEYLVLRVEGGDQRTRGQAQCADLAAESCTAASMPITMRPSRLRWARLTPICAVVKNR